MPSSKEKRRSTSSVIGTIATTAAVAYGAYRVVDWVVNNDDEEGNSSFAWVSSMFQVDEQRPTGLGREQGQQREQERKLNPRTTWKLRRQRVVKCRTETTKAYKSCWPSVRESIEAATNTSKETKDLKELRRRKAEEKEDTDQEQAELWYLIQLKTLTGLITTAYASTLLFLSLTLQIHWVGGKMMKDTENIDTARHQQVLMKTHDYFLKQGLPLLLETVRRTVSLAVSWKPTHFLSQRDIEKEFEKIHQGIQYGSTVSTSKKYPRNWARFLFPEDDDLDDEFWDIATSPVWEDAQVHVLMTTMDLFRDKGWKMAAFSESDKQQQPLAKLISPFRKASETINAEDVLDQTLKQFQTLPTVMELGDVSFQ